MREIYRRSGGVTPRMGFAELANWYERQLSRVTSMDDFRNLRMKFNTDDFITEEERTVAPEGTGWETVRFELADEEPDDEDTNIAEAFFVSFVSSR